MRLLINTDGIQFRVAGPAKAKQDYKDKERQATTRDGEPIWTARRHDGRRVAGLAAPDPLSGAAR